MRRLFCAGLLALLPTTTAVAQHRSALTLTSDDIGLTRSFAWAKTQATAFAFDSDAVGPWFEAALPGREAFCMRDVAHQVTGAHALGLQRHVKNMLGRFAAAIGEQRDWASLWEIDRHGQPAHADYRNDRDFWYNLPANFDVLDASWRMYLWSGDRAYLTDSTFAHFYDRTVTDYVARWQLGVDAVMHRPRMLNVSVTKDPDAQFGGNRGIPGYNEDTDDFAVGLDLLAAQYAGFAAYARIVEARGDRSAARRWLRNAAEVRALVNTRWWDAGTRTFYDHVATGGALAHRSAKAWNSAALYWPVADDGPRVQGALTALQTQIRSSPPAPIEEQSHHPEVLYRYGAGADAYRELLSLSAPSRERREYPEVSFSVVGAIVTGTMGVSVDPVPTGAESSILPYFVSPAVTTVAQLPPGASYAHLQHLPVRGNTIAVRHDGARTSRMTNERGPALVWQAAFTGTHAVLYVDGRRVTPAPLALPGGRSASATRVVVAPGTTVRVSLAP